MKVKVKYYEAEVEVELPDTGVEIGEKRDGYTMSKQSAIYKAEERTTTQVAIQIIAEACKAIREIREGGSHD